MIGKHILNLLIVAAVLAAPTVWAQPPGLERAMEVQDKHTGALMALEGVEGTGVGYDESGQAAIKIYTARVGVPGIPQALEQVPVQVVVTGKFVARADPTARFGRPVPIGVSTGHPDITAGTIGCRVTDGANVYVLSNNHVYANSNDASIGDDVIQPGAHDGGSLPDDYIGTLGNFVPIDFSGGDNTIDAAIAVSDTGLVGVATPGDGYGTPSSITVPAFVGQNVQKYGRTTGLTYGQVDAINATVDVCYKSRGPFRCVKLARFVDQIIITPGSFSDGGDSGSLIVTDDDNRNPVGLLFAGSSAHTVANPIEEVLGQLGVTIDSSPAEPGPLGITTTSLPGATMDVAYSAFVEATGGTEPYTWAIKTGVLPGGLSLDTTTGEISGTPVAVETQTFTVQVTDASETVQTATQELTVVVSDAPQGATTVTVVSITYRGEGGRDGLKHLNVTAALEDDLDNPVAGASVSIRIDNTTTSQSWTGTGTTGTDGTVTFAIKNAPSGCYTMTVTNVSAQELDWDGSPGPTNEFCK